MLFVREDLFQDAALRWRRENPSAMSTRISELQRKLYESENEMGEESASVVGERPDVGL